MGAEFETGQRVWWEATGNRADEGTVVGPSRVYRRCLIVESDDGHVRSLPALSLRAAPSDLTEQEGKP